MLVCNVLLYYVMKFKNDIRNVCLKIIYYVYNLLYFFICFVRIEFLKLS